MRISKFKTFHNESIQIQPSHGGYHLDNPREDFLHRCNYKEEQLVELGHIFDEISDCGIDCYLYTDGNEDDVYITSYNYNDDDSAIIGNDEFIKLCEQAADRLKITYGENRRGFSNSKGWGIFSYDTNGGSQTLADYSSDCRIKDIHRVKYASVYECTFNLRNFTDDEFEG